MNKNNEKSTMIGVINIYIYICISLTVIVAKIKYLNCVVILFGNIIFKNVYNHYSIIFK